MRQSSGQTAHKAARPMVRFLHGAIDMLTSIVKATRAHYAALQHRNTPSDARVALDYEVPGFTAGTVWVVARTKAQWKANCTRLINRLSAMYPEAQSMSVRYRQTGSTFGGFNGKA